METVFEDVLRGADAIAEFLFGRRSDRRTIYSMVEKGQIPVFRAGSMICARKSALRANIQAQERKSLKHMGRRARQSRGGPAKPAPLECEGA
jgi:hypothetical protein